MNQIPPRPATILTVGAIAILLAACGGTPPPAPRPVSVSVLRLAAHPVTVTEEYPAQIEASNTAEIRARVSGMLDVQHALEGQAVKAGQELFVIDQQAFRTALAQAQATLAQAEAARAQAVRDLARARPLSAVDALSLRELDAATAAEATASAQVQSGQASVRSAQINLDHTVIRSPIDGIMSRAQVRSGSLVTNATTLLTTVYQTDPMYVNFSISEQRLLALQRELGRPPDQRNPSRRTFRVFQADGTEIPTPATLNFIDAAVDTRTDTLPLRLAIPNPKNLLRAGQYVKVAVETAERADALLIPQRAVQELQDKRFVWTVTGDGKAESRDVTMGTRIGPDWLVETGLKPGDVVVVDGVQKLKPGVAVQIDEPAAAPKPTP